MSLLGLLQGRNRSAPVARDRLQVLLAHERALSGGPTWSPCCRRRSWR